MGKNIEICIVVAVFSILTTIMTITMFVIRDMGKCDNYFCNKICGYAPAKKNIKNINTDSYNSLL